MYDVVIIGGGPAGFTAAIYTSRARLKTLLIESFTVPGQAVITSEIENYPGFPEGTNGFDLIDKFKKQARKFGTEIKTGDVKGVKACKVKGKKAWQVDLGGEIIETLSVIIASGARPSKLGVKGEERLRGKGVSYCAVCDAALFKNKEVIVIGGGNVAVEEAVFLTKFASKVSLVHRRDRLRATKIVQEKAFANKKLAFIWDSVVTEIMGQNKVEAVKIKNIKTGSETNFPCEGVFVFVGYTPNTDFLKKVVKLDKSGYVLSDEDMKTSKYGIFVSGDARKKLLKQIITACGEGATASESARLYVEELKGVSYGV